MFRVSWCCKHFSIKHLFRIEKENNDLLENKDIPQQSFIDIGNILLKNGGIDLLEPKDNTIIESLDIPEESFLDLGKTLFENTNSEMEEYY